MLFHPNFKFPPNFERLVLGCIETNFCVKALDEIKIYMLLHRSDLNISAKIVEIEAQHLDCEDSPHLDKPKNVLNCENRSTASSRSTLGAWTSSSGS